MKSYRCEKCGEIFQVEEAPRCPKCNNDDLSLMLEMTNEDFKLIEENREKRKKEIRFSIILFSIFAFLIITLTTIIVIMNINGYGGK